MDPETKYYTQLRKYENELKEPAFLRKLGRTQEALLF